MALPPLQISALYIYLHQYPSNFLTLDDSYNSRHQHHHHTTPPLVTSRPQYHQSCRYCVAGVTAVEELGCVHFGGSGGGSGFVHCESFVLHTMDLQLQLDNRLLEINMRNLKGWKRKGSMHCKILKFKGVAQLVVRLTRNRWMPVSREFDSHQGFPLFPWARNFTLIA